MEQQKPEKFPRLADTVQPPLPDPREQVLAQFRDRVRAKIQQITGIPDGGPPIEVRVAKRGRRPPRITDNDLERAKQKIVEFARNNKPTLLDYIMRDLDKPSETRPGMTYGEELAECYREQMRRPGSFQYFKEIIDRQHGKVPDKVETEISVKQPNLPLMLNDFNNVRNSADEVPPEDPPAGHN